MLSCLQLEKFRLISLNIEANENYQSDCKVHPDYAARFGYGVMKAEDKLLFRLPFEIDIKSEEDCLSCSIRKLKIRAEGIFSFRQDTSEDLIEKMMPFNCLAILFGIVRGIVISATSSFEGGAFLLPAFNLTKLSEATPVEKTSKKRKKAKKQEIQNSEQ